MGIQFFEQHYPCVILLGPQADDAKDSFPF